MAPKERGKIVVQAGLRDVLPFEPDSGSLGLDFDVTGPSHVDIKLLEAPFGDLERKHPQPGAIYRPGPHGLTVRITVSPPTR